MGVESGTVQLQDIFGFQQSGVDLDGRVQGQFNPSGFIPSFYEQLRDLGKDMDMSIFSGNSPFDDENIDTRKSPSDAPSNSTGKFAVNQNSSSGDVHATQ